MSLYFVIIKKGDIFNTNNVINGICIIRSLHVLIITIYENKIRKLTVNKFLDEKTHLLNVSTTTSLQV
jgi:hypothetical protein